MSIAPLIHERQLLRTKDQELTRFLSRNKIYQTKMSKQAYEFCFCYRRMFKLRMAEPPEDVVNLFNEYSDNGVMTVESLHKFLVDFQGEEKATLEHAQAIFNSLKHHHVFHRLGLNLDAFFRYLFGDLNPPLAPLGVHHDMNAPLAHYFLYTGHNSYLTGNQLSSASSIEPIIKALRSGVRVIELDLWPNSKRNDVEVYHGGTMTSPVELIKCLEAIKENAFYASDYPVIITFEDHLDSFLQAKVAQMVNKTFGNILFPGMDFSEFPSPESLKRKILISTKPPKESGDNLKEEEPNEHKIKDFNDISILTLGDTGESRHRIKEDAQIQQYKMEEEEDEEEDAVIPEYKRLISIHAVKRKGGQENLLKGDSKRVARLSLKEQKLEYAVRTRATDIIRFTQKNLLRVYPKGTRILSSNYDPFIGWAHGAQMVAFNMQGYGKYLWMMQGMFRANGGCGYVKKPDFLLSCGPNNEVFDPSIRRKVKKTLKVKLYMGDGWHLDFHHKHFNQYSPPDFFTKLHMLGVPGDKKKVKTVPIVDQWVPLWNEEFEFPLTVPELALLRIEVRDYNMSRRHDFGGQTCLPVSELQTGIRAIPLYNKKGEKYKYVKLLMSFQLLGS
ncbi:phosphoinositide phospholipase C 2-like [Chenopodium quinoa]|uniref:phosphoinositide phospholipase C 2-like n=1 Tax=Chenopodium quinoa TaxID=63459 RepID=UPI000B782896|nr:phosphoinositide phospholipase C 2-like [Chenopodium quinoa]